MFPGVECCPLTNHTFNRQFVDEDKGGPWRFRNKFDGSVPLRGHVDTSIPCGSQVCLLTIKSKVAAENNDTRYAWSPTYFSGL